MNVTQPLTPIRVEMPGSVPLMDRWKSPTPTLPATCTQEPTDPYISAIPHTTEQQHARD